MPEMTDKIRERGVSVVVSTNKPNFAANIFGNYQNQSWVKKELIIILNNDSLNISEWERLAGNDESVSVYQLPENENLGACLAFAINKAKYEFIAKFDDDDYYAPFYLSEAMQALGKTNADIVGKRSLYMYMTEKKQLFLRHPSRENRWSKLVCKREIFQAVPFTNRKVGTMIQFVRDCCEKGFTVYSSSRFNYTYVRREDNSHTWNPGEKYFLKTSKIVTTTSDYRKIVSKNIEEHLNYLYNEGGRMKIALICPISLPCPPIRSGAIEVEIDGAASCLAELNYNITVFSIQDPSLPNHENVNGVRFVRYPKKTYFQEVLTHLKKEFFDLVQVFNIHQWITRIKRATPKSLLILSLHNLRLGHVCDDNKSMQIIKTVDHIITVSNFLVSDIISQYPTASGKINRIYAGEDPSRFIPHYSKEGQQIASQMKQKLGIPNNYRIILFAGRLVEYKGCHHLIHAMKHVLEHFPETALVIVGSKGFGKTENTQYITELKTSAEKISKHIYFTDFIPVNKIYNYYTMSDIFVCPSQWEEPLARVLYEAMTAALPIVAANRGGIPEIISDGQNGFIIKQYDEPLAYAESINKLLKDEKLMRRIGTINRDLVCKRYNFKNYALNLSEIYNDLVRTKRSR